MLQDIRPAFRFNVVIMSIYLIKRGENMFKKIITAVLATLMLLIVLPTKVLADESITEQDTEIVDGEENALPSYSEITVLDDTTLVDNNNVFYKFSNHSDLEEFISILDGYHAVRYRSPCLPGDPAYPGCNGNPVVSVYTRKTYSYQTGAISSNEYLLGTWTYGGPAGASMTISQGVTATVSIEGNGFSVTVGTAQTFNVPPGVSGNVKLRAWFRVDTYTYVYKYRDGSQQTGASYNTYTITRKEAYPVFQ